MKPRTSTVSRTVIVWVFVAWCMLPILWLVSTSLKTDVQAFSPEPVWFFTPQWGNYVTAWVDGGMARAMATSTGVAVISSLVGILGGVPLAYLTTQVWEPDSAISRRVSVLILLLTTVPPVLGLTPLFRTATDLDIAASPVAITFVHSFFALLLAFLILRSFMEAFPREIREAAMIDGAGEWKTLLRCILPNMVGGLFATFVLALIQSWNEYLYALVLTSGASQTVPVKVSGFLSFVGTNWSNLTAAGVIGTLPIVIFAIIVRKYLAQGLTYGGVK